MDGVWLEQDAVQLHPRLVLPGPVERGVVPARPQPDPPVPRRAHVDVVGVAQPVRDGRVSAVQGAPAAAAGAADAAADAAAAAQRATYTAGTAVVA